MAARFYVLLLIILPVVLLACERPLTEPEAPSIALVEPADLTDVRSEARLPIAVRARSFATVERVQLDGQPMTYDAAAELWRDTLTLWQRVTTFHVEAFATSQARRDTFHAAYVPRVQTTPGPALPAARGGHTTTRLNDGRLLVIGGAPSAVAPASPRAFVTTGTASFTPLAARLRAPRTGHTATLLPDGRVLLLGGSRIDTPGTSGDLVASVEVFDPATNSFTAVPVRGELPRRTLHTTTVHRFEGHPYLDVYGGLGAVPFGSDERIEARDDLRTFVFRNDSLVDLSGPLGPILWFDEESGQPVAPFGHTQTPLSVASADDRSLLAGSLGGSEDVVPLGLIVDFGASPLSIEQLRAPFVSPRRRHATVLIDDDVVVHLGGRAATGPAPSELFAAGAGTAFSFPSSHYRAIFTERYGHTATILARHRILIVGGFTPTGNGLATSRWVDVPLTP